MVQFSRTIKQLSLSIMLLFMGLFYSGVASASHFAAVDIWANFVDTSNGTYRYVVYLSIYKVCEPGNAGLGTSETLYRRDTSCSDIQVTQTLPMVQGPDTLDKLCPNFAPINSCRVPGSQWIGFERRIYADTVVLPNACEGWKFWWTSGSRNGGIVNLQNPSSQNIWVEMVLNNVKKYDNNSPRFAVDPIPYYCLNVPTTIYNGPVDPDGDSFAVVKTVPRGTNGAPLNFVTVPPYSVNNPFNSPTGFNLNPTNGTATLTPSATGKFVAAYRCNEYDNNGNLMGYVTRDVQVAILGCSTGPPIIDEHPTNVSGGFFDTTFNYMLTCPGSPIKFDVTASSITLTNSVYMTVFSGLQPGMSLTVANQGSSPVTGTFSWTPTINDTGFHVILIEAKDSTCNNNEPLIFPSYITIGIKVISGVNAGPDRINFCVLDNKPMQLLATTGSSLFDNYSWYNQYTGDTTNLINPYTQTPFVHNLTQNTPFVVTVPGLPPSCKGRDTVIVYIDTTNSVKISPASPIIQCRPGYVQLATTVTGPPPLQNIQCGTSSTLNCASPDSTIIAVPSTASTPTGPASNTAVTPFYGSGSYITVKHQYLLTSADMIANGMKSGTLKGLTFFLNSNFSGTQTFNNFRIALKCVPTSQSTLIPSSGFVGGTTPVYIASGPVTLPPGGPNVPVKFNFDVPYNWDASQNLIVEVCFANTSATGWAMVNSYATSYVSTIYALASSGNICNGGNATINSNNNVPQMQFNYCPVGNAPFPYKWVNGYLLSDSTSGNPVAYVKESVKYYAYIKGLTGCSFRDSVVIFMPKHDFTVTPKDTAVCEGESVLLIARPDRPSFDYKWFQVNNNTGVYEMNSSLDTNFVDSVIATPTAVGMNVYALVMTDSVSCTDTLFSNIDVLEKPVVNILNNDTIIKYGTQLQLLVTGGFYYSWSPVGSLSDPNIVNPVASPTEPTRYYVVGVAQNSCRSIDSVFVAIDYRDNLFVPTAFTPNGDGKNDLFRVSNFTFQKVMEFRIYNRWGQEVFSANDNRGWDGTWKNKPQDMDSYHYIIKVGYPDGLVETYKGDITLVR